MTDYLDEIQARAEAASRKPASRRANDEWLDKWTPSAVLAVVAALRAVEALCDAGDEAAANATRAYPEGEPDPGPPPAWVWADDIRTAIRDALEAR